MYLYNIGHAETRFMSVTRENLVTQLPHNFFLFLHKNSMNHKSIQKINFDKEKEGRFMFYS